MNELFFKVTHFGQSLMFPVLFLNRVIYRWKHGNKISVIFITS